MKKPIIAGVLIIAMLILGYFGYKKVEERTNETLKNLTPTQLKEIAGEETKEKTEEVLIVEHEVVAEKKTSNSENVKKSTKKSSKNVKTTTKKNTTKKNTTKKNTSTKKVAYNKTELQSYAHNLVISYGWSEYDYECLIKLWNRESSWNPNAVNKKSGACGIPQSLPCKKMVSEGSDYKTNGKTQIRWGLKYIKNRYGSPSNAWAHSQKTGWY